VIPIGGEDITNLPTRLDTGHRRQSPLEQLADIPEEEIWLQKRRSARTRRTTCAALHLLPRRSRTAITTALENGAQLEDMQKAGRRDPGATKLYDRRRYNPEKAASFFAKHWR
jgi:hypothetical protein